MKNAEKNVILGCRISNPAPNRVFYKKAGDKVVITSKHYGYIKWTIHISALALSWRMVFDTMTKMSTAPFWQVFFGFGAVFVELFAQFDWGLALACAKTGHSWKAFWLKAIYLIYIVIFAFLSAVGTFSGQVNKSEQIYSQADFDKSNLQDKIKRDEKQIQNKTDEQKIEFADHGRGRKYNQLQAEIDDLKAEQAGFEAELKKASMITISSEKSVFDSMHDMIPKVPSNGFKMAFFAALMLMIYTALILTPWKVDPRILSGDDDPSESSGVSSKPQNNKEVLSEVPEPLSEVSSGVSEVNLSELSEQQNKMIYTVESLYDVEDDSDPPKKLKDLTQAWRDIMNKGVTWRDFRRYKELLEQIGAIKIEIGKNAEGVWEKNKIIEYIKSMAIN